MVYLKYYQKENDEFQRYSNIILTELEVLEFIKKCCIKFKVPEPTIQYAPLSRNTLGTFFNTRNLIKFNSRKKISLLTTAHELAHAFDVHFNGQYVQHKRSGETVTRKAHTSLHRKQVMKILRFYDMQTKWAKRYSF